MKTVVIESEVHTNTSESSFFKIKNNAKAYRLLIDGLYSNKIQSVTREIWSNALDSHIQAGIGDIPFEVSFPSVFDPTFRVKDFGIGLSHTQITDLYTTLFESTKEDSNEYVGKYGIGSKSPFAYTDSFSVTSVKDGEKNYYTAMMNSYGIPEIHHLHSEVVDEGNGVEVSFPVKKYDVSAFQTAAKRVSLGFDVKPKISNHEEYEWPQSYSEVLSNGIYVRMGCVLYPVDVDIFIDHVREKDCYPGIYDFGGFLRRMESMVTVFEVEMGSVEILPSREGLQYGPHDPTIGTLMKVFVEYYQGLIPKINDILAKAPSSFRAVNLFRSYDNSYITVLNEMYNCGITQEEVSFFTAWSSYITRVEDLHWRGDYSAFKSMNRFVNCNQVYNIDDLRSFGYYHSGSTIEIGTRKEQVQIHKYESTERSKFGNLSSSISISITPYGKNIYLIGDVNKRNPSYIGSKRVSNHATRYTKDIIRKINDIKKNCRFNGSYSRHSDNVTYIQFDSHSSESIKHRFFNELSDFIEGIDYQIIFLDEYEIVSNEPEEVVKRAKKVGIEKLVDKVGYVYIDGYKDSIEYKKKHSGEVYLPYSREDVRNILLNVESKVLLIPYGRIKTGDGLFFDMRNYNNHDNGMYGLMTRLIKTFGLDCVLFVAASNMKHFESVYVNHLKFEDLDQSKLEDMYLKSKLNLIEKRKKDMNSYSPNAKYVFNNLDESLREYISELDLNSEYRQYVEMYLDTELKVCHSCNEVEVATDSYVINTFLKLVDEDKYKEYNEAIYSSDINNDYSEIENKFNALESIVETKYPTLVFCHTHMGYYKLRERDVVDYLIGYVKDMDNKGV